MRSIFNILMSILLLAVFTIPVQSIAGATAADRLTSCDLPSADDDKKKDESAADDEPDCD